MKSSALYWVLAVVGLVLFAAIYWIEININPVIKFPPAPVAPAQDAYDYFVAAESLDRDSDKWNFAAGSMPPGYKDPSDPDDRYYSLVEQKMLLAENLPMLAKVRQGLALPFVLRPMPPFSFGANAKLREDARLLGFAGKVYSEEGNYTGAIACELDSVQLGEKSSYGGGIIGRLIDIACEAIGRRHAWDSVGHLNAVQALSAARRLEAIQDSEYPLHLIAVNEKWYELTWLNQVFHAKNSTVLSFVPFLSMVGPSSSIKDYMEALETSKRAVVAGYSRYMDRFADRCRYPYGIARTMPPLAQPANPVVRVLTPGMDMFRLRDADNEAQNDLLMVSLVLHAYKLDHGRYPASLSQLTPAYLRAIPSDPFAQSSPLKYRATPTGYVLYSVGPDGRDDGGEPIFATTWHDGSTLTGQARYYPDIDSKGDIVACVNIN